jgi:hypothetical protein
MTPPEPTNEFLYQMMRQIEDGYQQGHRRLREDLVSLEARHYSTEKELNNLREQFIAFKSTPVDITNISYTTRTMVAIVVGTIGIVGSLWKLNSTLDDTRKELRMLQTTVTDFMINERRKTQ